MSALNERAWDEQEEAMRAAETEEEETAVWQASIMRVTALRHRLEGGATS